MVQDTVWKSIGYTLPSLCVCVCVCVAGDSDSRDSII